MAVGLRTDGVMGSEFSPRRSLEIKETDPIYERQSAPCPPFMGDSGRTQPYGSCWGWGGWRGDTKNKTWSLSLESLQLRHANKQA